MMDYYLVSFQGRAYASMVEEDVTCDLSAPLWFCTSVYSSVVLYLCLQLCGSVPLYITPEENKTEIHVVHIKSLIKIKILYKQWTVICITHNMYYMC